MSKDLIAIIDTSISCYPVHDEDWPRLAVCGEFSKKTDLDVQHVTVEVVLRGKKGQVLQLAEAFVETTFYDERSPFKVDCDYNPEYVREIDSVELRVIRCDVMLDAAPSRTFLSALPVQSLFEDEPFDPDDDGDNGFNEDDLH